MSVVEKKVFGLTKEGKEADLYTVVNKNGLKAVYTNYGAILVSLFVPDKGGNMADVVLGYDVLEKYFENAPNLGATIGRHANRIGGAKFELNGVTYELDKNDGKNNLHGGFDGYHKRLWDAKTYDEEDGTVMEFAYESADMDQGFPGNLKVTVCYKLTDANELVISYKGICDKDTVLNLTNHTYFNLAGHNSGTILDHKVWIDSDEFTFADSESIPNGDIIKVEGTPMDFRVEKAIRDGIDSDYQQIVWGKGYDHNWVLKTKKGELSLVATLKDEKTGRFMETYTDLPGMQFYSGNFLKGDVNGKDDAVYSIRTGLCFETQYYPNAINVPSFEQPVIKAGEEFTTVTKYAFKTV